MEQVLFNWLNPELKPTMVHGMTLPSLVGVHAWMSNVDGGFCAKDEALLHAGKPVHGEA